MRRGLWTLAIGGVLMAGNAFGQSTAPSAPTVGTTQPGIDVYSTIYPRSPTSNVTQPGGAYLPGRTAETPQPPIGIPAGNIILYPSITGGAFYDDNVFASNSNRRSDWAGFVRPELAWRTNNWLNVESAGAAFVEKRWYDKFTSEDQVNAGAAVGGTVRADENTQLVGRLQYLHAHEDRGTSDSITNTFDRPISYHQFEAAGAINQRYNRVWVSVGAAAAFVYYDNPTFAGSLVSQDYRNGTVGRVPVRLGYVVAPLTSVFVEASGNGRDFRVDTFDSQGYRVVAGGLFEPGPGARIKGEIFGGYMFQDYIGPTFQTVSTWTFGSALAFLLAPNLTAALEGRRDAKEASLSGGVTPGDGVSVIETVVAGRLDWLVAPNFVVGGGVAYIEDQYLGAGRTDRTWSPLASAKYFVNRHLTLAFDYRNVGFDSSGIGVLSYYRNVYLFSANLRI
jgi:hypothetical protein